MRVANSNNIYIVGTSVCFHPDCDVFGLCYANLPTVDLTESPAYVTLCCIQAPPKLLRIGPIARTSSIIKTQAEWI